ncbi:unnamed protein product, partial [Rotaria magnacalcarata]
MTAWVGFKFGMMGLTSLDRSLVLMLIDQAKDLRSELSRVCYYPAHDGFEAENNTFINVYLPRQLREWERFLSEHPHNGGWLVTGDEPTVADFVTFEYIDQCLEELEENDKLVASIPVENQQDHQSFRQEHQPIRQDHQPIRQEQKVSLAAARYALTRFPFAPFIVRLSNGNIKEKSISQDLEKYLNEQHQAEIQIASIRKSTTKCEQNEHDYLIYVKDS